MTPGQNISIEDLIVQNHKTFTSDLTGARAAPRDEGATSDFKADPKRMAKLAELAEVDAEDIVDVAIRGANVSFQVKDARGVVSAGFFPVASLEGRSTSEKREAGVVSTPARVDQAPQGGTATVPSVATENAGKPAGENSEGEPADGEPADGLPPDIDNLNADQVAGLLKDTPDGVDAKAVLAHEQARDGGMRVAVERAARKLGLLEDPPS